MKFSIDERKFYEMFYEISIFKCNVLTRKKVFFFNKCSNSNSNRESIKVWKCESSNRESVRVVKGEVWE